ncbi:MAG: hypothetical protein PHI40_08140 [Caldisericia bacterium]|nr:hypothetical protein [Caldisericia bacterium]
MIPEKKLDAIEVHHFKNEKSKNQNYVLLQFSSPVSNYRFFIDDSKLNSVLDGLLQHLANPGNSVVYEIKDVSKEKFIEILKRTR